VVVVMTDAPRVSICLNTFRRPELLERTLASLIGQVAPFAFEVIVVDNDAIESGRSVVERSRGLAEAVGVPLVYDVESVQNISLARNRAVQHTRGAIVAFIDDDEQAEPSWLAELHRVLEEQKVDGVFGPVLADFPQSFPRWLAEANLLPRPRYADGERIAGSLGRSGNAAIRREVLLSREGPFDPAYGLTGGGDSDLLRYLEDHGVTFAWADRAVVYERQSDNRARPGWYLRRSYRVGWTRMHRARTVQGVLRGVLPVLLLIVPSLIQLVVRSIRALRNPREMLLLLGMACATQLGKIGCLVGARLDAYRVDAP
jgi:glycosyltransferase involved in cell wall biosynthesis